MQSCSYCPKVATISCSCSNELMCLNDIEKHFTNHGTTERHVITNIQRRMLTKEEKQPNIEKITNSLDKLQSARSDILSTSQLLITNIKSLCKKSLKLLDSQLDLFQKLLSMINNELSENEIKFLYTESVESFQYTRCEGLDAFFSAIDSFYSQEFFPVRNATILSTKYLAEETQTKISPTLRLSSPMKKLLTKIIELRSISPGLPTVEIESLSKDNSDNRKRSKSVSKGNKYLNIPEIPGEDRVFQ